MTYKFSAAAMAAAGLLLPASALAHDGPHLTLTFSSGLAHPFTGWDHLALLTLGGVLLGSTRPSLSLDRRTLTGLFGMLGSGVAIMMDHATLAVLFFAVAFAALAIGREAAQRGRLMLAGAGAAIVVQMASHMLAWGDAPPSEGFALGYSAASTAIFAGAYLAARIVIVSAARSRTS